MPSSKRKESCSFVRKELSRNYKAYDGFIMNETKQGLRKHKCFDQDDYPGKVKQKDKDYNHHYPQKAISCDTDYYLQSKAALKSKGDMGQYFGRQTTSLPLLEEHRSETVQMPGSVDNYLGKVVPLLQSYWNDVYKITNQKLVFQEKVLPEHEPEVDQILQIPIHISVPLKFPKVVEEQRSGISEPHRPDVESDQVKSNKEALYLIELLKLYNRKLHGVFKCQRMTGQSEKAENLTNLMESLHALTQALEKITVWYTMKFFGYGDVDLPSLQDIHIVTEKVCNMMNNLKQDEFSDLFAKYNENFTTSYENIWCCILGLNDKVGTHLLELDDDMKMHQTWHYYVENFIESEESNLLKEDGYLEESGHDGLIKKFQKIGFTEERAGVIADSISDDLIDTQLPSYWAIKHLDFEVLYHPLLTNLPRFPFMGNGYDVWFKKDVAIANRLEPPESRASGSSQWQVNMINVTAEEGKTKVMEFLTELNDQRDYILLYHGTNHNSALSILQSGIKLSVGKPCQDFSNGSGFYVGEDFEMAKKRRPGSNAVVVFKVKKDLVNPFIEGGLDVTYQRGEWERIIRHYRNGCEDTIWEAELARYTFIRGQICKNPANALPGASGQCEQGKHQTCIRNTDYARKFGSIQNIACVIFH